MMASERRSAFIHQNVDRLLLLLREHGGMSAEGAEAAVHALIDIEHSVDTLYEKLIPALLSQETSADTLDTKDKIWDLREEFRHIDYHVHDSGLLDI